MKIINKKLKGLLMALAVITHFLAVDAFCESIEYIYDDLGRMEGVVLDDGTLTYFEYDEVGNRITVEKRFQLTINKDGTGSVIGTVTSHEATPLINCGADCSEVYADDSYITLTATIDAPSSFEGWSDPSCTGTTCQVFLDSSKIVTATFEDNSIKARIVGKSYYTSLQLAYDAAGPNDEIRSKASIIIEDLLLDRGIPVTFRGGYDSDFTNVIGMTTLGGSFTTEHVNNADVTLGNFIIGQ